MGLPSAIAGAPQLRIDARRGHRTNISIEKIQAKSGDRANQVFVGGKGGIQAVIAIYTDASKAQHVDNRYIEFVPTMDSNFIHQAYLQFARAPAFVGFVSDEQE
jgi:hypothetical protein